MKSLDNIKNGKRVIEILKEKGELTTCEIGDVLWGNSPNELNWQRYSRPAGKLLASLEKNGYVKKRIDSGRGYYRTYWKILNV